MRKESSKEPAALLSGLPETARALGSLTSAMLAGDQEFSLAAFKKVVRSPFITQLLCAALPTVE